MQFLKVATAQVGKTELLNRLQRELESNQQVLWLVPGGSNIPLTVEVMNALPDELTARLTILLTDERFGPVGHKDSNQVQLHDAGFSAKRATFLEVLMPDMPLEATRRHYDALAQNAFREADIIIGQFGIGADGHIAGILPGSPAVATPDFVAAYEADPFTRLTLTFHALKRLAVAYAFVFGDTKREALTRLKEEMLPFSEEPSQVLKELPEAYVYNDQVGQIGE